VAHERSEGATTGPEGSLLILQARNDGVLCQRDLSEHDKGSTGIRSL